MNIETIYESFVETYRNMGYMISELSKQTIKTAAVEAERRAKESEDVKEYGTEGEDGQKTRDLASRNAKVKRRQAEKFRKKLYVKSGGTARADAVPDYKSGGKEDAMDAAALKRHPYRPDARGRRLGAVRPGEGGDPKGRVMRDPQWGNNKSAYGKDEFKRQTKRYK
jgi:hypothetical protein